MIGAILRGCLLVIFSVLVVSVTTQAESRLNVYTVNYPLMYFAERIGGDLVDVSFPAPPDVDPAFWAPDTEIVRQYQQADLIILNGADYAKWTQKVSLPMLRCVNTSRAFKDELIQIQSTVTHSHGPEGDHSHGGTAFTTWLDFSQAAAQAEAVYQAFSRKQPTHKTAFTTNFEALKKDLLELDTQMKSLGVHLDASPLVASHPIYQYMARRYGFNLKMVMWEPDTDPGEQQWQFVQNLLRGHSALWMIWEGEPLDGSARRLEKMGVRSLVFSPCFAVPEKGDFLSVMQENIDNLKSIFH